MDAATKRKRLKARAEALTQMRPDVLEEMHPSLHIEITDEYILEQLKVHPNEVAAFEEGLTIDFADANLDDLLGDCRKRVIEAIINPLGLGKFIAAYDRIGGNVNTIYNVRKKGEDGKPIATEEFQEEYEQRGEYNSKEYHGDPKYTGKNREDAERKEEGQLTDAYTGQRIGQNQPHELDHTVSAYEIENDPGRILAGTKGTELANSPNNLKPTNRSVNRSKGAKSMAEFVTYLEETRENRLAKIEELQNKAELTDKERKELEKNEALESFYENKEEALEIDKKARKEIDRKINKDYYQGEEFRTNLVKTSGREAFKMGLQQAIGLLLVDLANACLDELADSYRKGFVEGTGVDNGWEALEIRLKNVTKNVGQNWKNIVVAFRDGALSGFISNLITTFINTFFTTAKNIVRLIREGTFIVFRAAKTILFPPKDMTLSEVWDSALKILVAGAATVGGIALETSFSTLFAKIPVINSFASILSPIAAGILTAVVTSVAIYSIEKWDPFGAREQQKRRHIREKLLGIESMLISNREKIRQEFASIELKTT